MNLSSYSDEQLLNLVNNSILKNTEFSENEFSGGSISVTSVHKNTRQNYKVNLYFGYRGKNPVNRSFDIKQDFYFIWCKAIHLKVMSIASDNLGADFNELNELMKSPENKNNAVVSSKLDSSTVVRISTEPKDTLQDTLKGKRTSLRDQIAEKLQKAEDVINIQAFNEWMEYKKYKSISSITKTINFLSVYDFATQQQIVDKSIMNSYAGLFEPKANQNVHPKSFKQIDAEKTDRGLGAFLAAREQGFDLRNISSEDDVQDAEVIEG